MRKTSFHVSLRRVITRTRLLFDHGSYIRVASILRFLGIPNTYESYSELIAFETLESYDTIAIIALIARNMSPHV